MAKAPSIVFSNVSKPVNGSVVLLAGKGNPLPDIVNELDGTAQIKRAADIADFDAKHLNFLQIMAPGEKLDRVILAGCGDLDNGNEDHWLKLGGKLQAQCSSLSEVVIIAQSNGKEGFDAKQLALIAMGMKLRSYDFDLYKTPKPKSEQKSNKTLKVSIASSIATAARREWKKYEGIADGVILARDLVNEPANKLGPVEFTRKAQKLSSLGVKVEVLGEKEMKALKMDALLGVNLGSERPPRLVVMRWNGGKAKDAPLAFVGKGVVFDTGGISMKPPAGMGDMKGDMGGAAAVTGLMHALAARKAKANVIGIIGLVENMPDGKAQRPGDIVKSMSGQTIEILNTDAEGRLVLADALWYCQKKYKPKFMVNLATLTGAILVALGNHHAGLFSNNDELAKNITAAGIDTDEKVWRMPLAKEYDKLIDTKNADMKNIGGRFAGSITAGQFLQRFVNDVPWAHLDIAGTAMGSPQNEFNKSWGSGFGVRLLDRMVANNYE